MRKELSQSLTARLGVAGQQVVWGNLSLRRFFVASVLGAGTSDALGAVGTLAVLPGV